jgi:iron complex transport system substrate-binding protein
MPRRETMRERLSLAVIGILAATSVALVAPARAAELPRIASINACTDQLLVALADPDQNLGLGP